MRLKLLRWIIFYFVFNLSLVTARSNHFGIEFGGNYFRKTDRVGFKVYKGDRYLPGKYCLDNDGFSYQLGVVYYLNERFSIMFKYRTPRKCEYHYPSAPTPDVWGPNTYWTRTEASSWIASFRVHFEDFLFFKPYVGFGIDFFKVKAGIREGHIRQTGEILYIYPEDGYRYIGSKNVIGLMIPLGVTVPILERVLIDFGLNYTFMKIKDWGTKDDRADNQNLSGFYIYFDLVILVF